LLHRIGGFLLLRFQSLLQDVRYLERPAANFLALAASNPTRGSAKHL
jgi:hypothetical protein